ncbi:unnamed protein product [Euphydryas editha]|uniref:DUF5641 domain-containing protein n=1 Tax=Euphydryas editha TaxID=104508 RepID=A0AAU9TMR0_EUPED|nr:unnamed protein product [Euphydryas editha]
MNVNGNFGGNKQGGSCSQGGPGNKRGGNFSPHKGFGQKPGGPGQGPARNQQRNLNRGPQQNGKLFNGCCMQSFWRRWSQEYSSNLIHRYKWSSKIQEPKFGDVVLIKEDNLPLVDG